MLKLLGLCISCLLIGITVGLPTKDFDELIYRLEELKQQNHYVGGGRRPRTTEQNNNSILIGKPSVHHMVDLEEKPLLYEYYANTLNPIIDRRNFEEIDSHLGKRSSDDFDRYPKRFFLERSRTLPSLQEQQQKLQMHNFHEVADKSDYQEYMKRMLNDDRVVANKRNFDEIDRFGLNRFIQTPPSHAVWSKRNFDEIDRLVPQVFTDNKREEGSNDMSRSDFNQYYNLALLKDVERTSAAFGLGTPNDFLPPINSLKATALKQYQSTSEPNSISKKPSSPNRMTVSSTCSPTPSIQASNRLQSDAMTNLADNQNTCDRLPTEINRFDGYGEGIAIPPNAIPSNTTKTNPLSANLPSIDHFQCILNRRQRGEKRPIPDEQKDEKYFERRKRNNEAAKKSRDARKIREDRIAFRAALLEQENAILRAQILALREELATLQQMICNRANI